MLNKTQVKICGIKEVSALQASIQAGARFVGFVFYPPSPRHIEPAQAAHLIRQLPSTVKAVGLFVDPTDEQLTNALGITPLDYIQLHGEESIERVAQIKASTKMPIIKAFPVRSDADIEAARAYEEHVDWLLFDAKPADADLPGGTGQSFDWSLMQGKTFTKPWMLSGGLTPENVSDALSQLSPDAVDVSSGVESERGVKDVMKVKAFIQAAHL